MTAFLIRLLLPPGADPGDPQVRQRCGSVSGGVGIALNALLFLGKLLSGLATGSIAVVADASTTCLMLPPLSSPWWGSGWPDRTPTKSTPSATDGWSTSPVWWWPWPSF